MFEDVEEIKPAEGKSDLHFYYNREERIARAPRKVQQYYENPSSMQPVRGIKIFFTKQNRFILVALIFFVAFAWIYSTINRSRDQIVINDVVYDLSAFSYEEEVYITIKSHYKNPKKADSALPFTANIFAVNSDNQVQEKIILEGTSDPASESAVRTKVRDFDIKRIDVILDSQNDSKELSAFVKR
ncbi:MAG: hypothetical protein K5786_12495 [Treponema sp.]|nr:hypothetical protein [Treponema sp.]